VYKKGSGVNSIPPTWEINPRKDRVKVSRKGFSQKRVEGEGGKISVEEEG